MQTDEVRASDARVNVAAVPLVREIRTTDDYQALREAWTALPRLPRLLGAGEGAVILADGRQVIRAVLTGDESAGALQVSYVTLEPGPGAPPHHQPREDELWFALDGEWEWTVGETTMRVGKGAFAYIPRNTTHRFANVGTTTAAMFTLNTPAGHERGFRKAGENPDMSIAERRAVLAAHDFVFHR
ncbi:hypothetical protein sos41_41790 [Alphaproteobacteria bacterium SO-S41]|nr:hypothetical protein sos41_41790 [Alphaproteobacteria bacterium SO-S41]